MRGKRFIIANRNKPFAEFRPLTSEEESKHEVIFGVLKGRFKVESNFNAPVPDFERDFYGE
jgi:hypothetical protein